MSNSNIQSLVFYNVLLADCQKSLAYWEAQPLDAIERDTNIKNYGALIASHENEIHRLNAQIEDPAEAKSDLEQFLDQFRKIYAIVKDRVPENIRKWIEAIIAEAEKLIKINKNF